MDAACDDEVTDCTYMTSGQVGKTEIINNILGYHIDQDPCPVMVVMPTEKMGNAYSKDRLEPMIRDTEALRDKVSKAGARSKENTLLHKSFPGGHVTISGANSPASLSSRPIRIVLCDEVDRYPYSAGEEGDPQQLAYKRTQTFFNKKRIDTSTPTVKGLSRIERRYKAGDMRKYYVPCHKCGHCQELVWAQVKFTDKDKKRVEPYYECDNKRCKAHWTEAQKRKNVGRAEDVKGGGWIVTNKNGAAGHRSFTIWEVYSPWSTMEEIVEAFLDAKENPHTLQTFVNTVLAQSWEESGETVSSHKLMNRRERYTHKVPHGILVLVAGVDIQKNRIEGETIGYGRGQECWGVEKWVIMGDTNGDDVWEELDEKLATIYDHESGHKLKIAAVCIDSGHQTKTVYQFCALRSTRRIWAVKGKGGPDVPLVAAPTKKKTVIPGQPVDLYIIGTDDCKGTLYARFRVRNPGPGYCHFPESPVLVDNSEDSRTLPYDEEYFNGLTAEKALTVYTKGFPRIVWTKPAGQANEPLDIRVYAYVALTILNPVWSALEKRLESKPPDAEQSDVTEQPRKKRKRRARTKAGFVGGFKK